MARLCSQSGAMRLCRFLLEQKYIQAQILALAWLDNVLGRSCTHSQTLIDEYIAKSVDAFCEAEFTA